MAREGLHGEAHDGGGVALVSEGPVEGEGFAVVVRAGFALPGVGGDVVGDLFVGEIAEGDAGAV